MARLHLLLVAAALAAPAPALAAPRKPPAKKEAKLDAKPLLADLASGDPAKVAAALGAAKAAGARAAEVAPAIEELLRRGVTRALVEPAIDALEAIGLPSSSATLRAYLDHRAPDVRRAAARALGATRGPDGVAALRGALRHPDAEVRGHAAVGLGRAGATEALPELFLALDKGVALAAPAIGATCAEADCEKLLGRLGKLAFDVVLSGLDPVVRRTTTGAKNALPDAWVIRALGRVRDLGTPDAKRWLEKLSGDWPKDRSPAVKRALEQLIPTIVVRS